MLFWIGVGWGLCTALFAWCAWTAPIIDDPDDGSFPETGPNVLVRLWNAAARQWGKL